jgi:glycosyltransferase involved in cell wall biosynthesis
MLCPSVKELPPRPDNKIGWPWDNGSAQLPELMSDGEEWPKVTVVTPSYQQGVYIEESIRSVLLQGYPNAEYIIIDGGSTDSTVKIIYKYEKWISDWVSETDRGQSHALNKAIAKATGEFVFWLNADDFLLLGALFHAVEDFISAEKPDVIVYGFEMMDADGDIIGEKMPLSRMAFMNGRYSPVDCFSSPAIAFRRSVVVELGGFDERLNWPMDFEFLCRARQRGKKVVFLDKQVLRFRVHNDSKTCSPLMRGRALREEYSVHQRFWPRGIVRLRYWWRCGNLRGEIIAEELKVQLAQRRWLMFMLIWCKFPLLSPASLLTKRPWSFAWQLRHMFNSMQT